MKAVLRQGAAGAWALTCVLALAGPAAVRAGAANAYVVVDSDRLAVNRWLSPRGFEWRRRQCSSALAEFNAGKFKGDFERPLPGPLQREMKAIPPLWAYAEGEHFKVAPKGRPALSLSGPAGYVTCGDVYVHLNRYVNGIVSPIANGRTFRRLERKRGDRDVPAAVNAMLAEDGMVTLWFPGNGPLDYIAFDPGRDDADPQTQHLWYHVRNSRTLSELKEVDGRPIACIYGFNVTLVTDLDSNGRPEILIRASAGDTDAQCLDGLVQWNGRAFERF